jgi:hypothetical protein
MSHVANIVRVNNRVSVVWSPVNNRVSIVWSPVKNRVSVVWSPVNNRVSVVWSPVNRNLVQPGENCLLSKLEKEIFSLPST